jgi:predicted ATPase
MRVTDGIVQPLRNWRVRNFKSIAGAQIDLLPLTVLVGANSSGKSSFLQSILLVVQAMQGQSCEEHLPLNGPFVELGDFHDLRHAGATGRDRIGLGGTFALATPERRLRANRSEEDDRSDKHRTVMEWDMELLHTGRENLPGRARLRGVRFSIGSDDSRDSMSDLGKGPLEYTANVLSRRPLDLRVPPRRPRRQRVVRLEGRVTSGDAADRRRSIRTAGVSHRAGVPIGVFVQGDLHAVLTAGWVRRARHVLRDRSRKPKTAWNRIRRRPVGGPPVAEGKEDEARMNELATTACDWLIDLIVAAVDAERDTDGGDTAAAAELMEGLDSSRSEAIDVGYWPQLHSLVSDPEFALAIERRLGAGEPVLLPGEELELSRVPADLLELGGSEVASFFADRVVYLGPLRQDPQVLCLAVPTDQPGYVGTKGEFAFAVLHRDADREVLCPLATGGTARMPLRAAVNHWLDAFGLAAAIDTIDRPRLGLEPRVLVSGVDRPLDMTAVGVGVSQLVPVLVMGLHAEPGTVLVIEQPELHLHPAMQQTLADFLLACVRGGRQVIVETHSDHLVTRLRRRIAEDESDEVLNLVGMVSTERRDGATRFRRLATNRFGGFDDWPEGFFDQGSRDAQRLLQAGMRKKQGGSG